MARKKGKKIQEKKGFFHYAILLIKTIWFIIKIPYYLVLGIYYAARWIMGILLWTKEKIRKKRAMAKKGAIKPVYEDFRIVKTIEGDYKKWEENLNNAESKIGIILGARGSGKTAIGIKFLENIHAKTNKNCYAIGFHGEDFPPWINVVDDISQIKNNSIVLIDEGGILFSSRNSMSNANKLLSNLILVARHKNLSIIFISQNSSNLEVNIQRQADFLVLKPSSLLQKEFERKIIQKLYDELEDEFKKYENEKGIAHIYSNNFKGFVANPLPSFWDTNISKSFK